MTVLLSPFRWKFFFPIRFRWLQLLKADQFHPLNSEYCIPKSSIWLQGHKSMFLFYDAFFSPPPQKCDPSHLKGLPDGPLPWESEDFLRPVIQDDPLLQTGTHYCSLTVLFFFVIKALLFFLEMWYVVQKNVCIHLSIFCSACPH